MMLSASLEVVASLVTVPARFSSDFLASSSISMILRERAETSPSTSLYIFSFSSRDSVAFCSLSQVSSNSLKTVNFLAIVPDVAVSLVGPPVGLLGLLLKVVDDGVETVRLRLERLHLLADGVHFYRL